MKFLALINPENISEEEAAKFDTREAARAVVYDKSGNVGILNVSKHHYHKLPGGGVEDGESIEGALKRECFEELGCDAEVTGEIGSVVEYRGKFNLKQTSFCFFAKVKGEKGTPSFTEEEREDGFEVQWLPLREMTSLLVSDQPTDYEGAFIIARDRVFLGAAQNLF